MKNTIELAPFGEGPGGEVDFRHMVTQRNIVGGQKVNPVKKERAKLFQRSQFKERDDGVEMTVF
jgi:hypothetical protein